MARHLLGDNIIWDSLSEQQKWILDQRANNIAVAKVVNLWKSRFPNETGFGKSALETCIISSVLGLHWQKGENIGSHPYLCSHDLALLEQFIEIQSEEGEECPIELVLEEAKKLKISRNSKAITCLRLLNHIGLADKLAQVAVKAPSNSWVSNLNELIAVKTEHVIYIDKDRFYSCHEEVIQQYFRTYKEFIDSYPPSLRFGADETMLQPKLSSTSVVPENANAPIQEGAPEVPHITAMCCHNCTGKRCPLFIILKQLQRLPQELKEFEEQGDARFASSNKGYMTRDLFLCWVINFVNWLSFERASMSAELRNKRALLIVDGQVSRECPLAVKIPDDNKVDLLILPSHCTHVLQMLDVVLASTMKKKFGKLFKETYSNENLNFRTAIAKVRYAVVYATISSWQSACTKDNCMKAARKTGTFPCLPDEPLKSPYVRALTEAENQIYLRRVEYAQRNFVCSCKQLNNLNVLIDLCNKISQRDDLKHLRIPFMHANQVVASENILNFVRLWNKNGCKLLSRFHPLLKDGHHIVEY